LVCSVVNGGFAGLFGDLVMHVHVGVTLCFYSKGNIFLTLKTIES
jgi:hypothetical protein